MRQQATSGCCMCSAGGLHFSTPCSLCSLQGMTCLMGFLATCRCSVGPQAVRSTLAVVMQRKSWQLLDLQHHAPCFISRWEKFSAVVASPDYKDKASSVGELFPFKEYFADAPQPLFKGNSYEEVSNRLLRVVMHIPLVVAHSNRPGSDRSSCATCPQAFT